VGGSHRGAMPLAVAALGLGLVLGACSSPTSRTEGVASSNDLPLATSAPVTPSAPASPPSPSATAATTTKPAPKARAKAKRATYAFPVIGHNSYAHTHHDYPATDIITNCGNRVVAVTTGTILAVTRVDRWTPSQNLGATRGGLSVSLLGDDGVRYYGSHLSVINADINPGARVTTGQTLGKTGRTGDAGACHLHFGISPPCAKVGDWWIQRGTVYPWPYLDAWRKGEPKSAVAAVAAWHAKHGCPAKPLTLP
jgi:murein DD-endopeptidase MepM/ murein hydrolase activator NlpD